MYMECVYFVTSVFYFKAIGSYQWIDRRLREPFYINLISSVRKGVRVASECKREVMQSASVLFLLIC